MTQKITAWSFSRWKDYEQCPQRAKFKHVDKLKEPPVPAMERGITVHKLAEDYTAKRIKKLPQELRLFKDKFKDLRDRSASVEESLAFTATWDLTDWYSPNAWVRVKTDASYCTEDTVTIVDHKTGRKREDHLEQLSLYAVAGMIRSPSATQVVTQLWYLDVGEMTSEVFDTKQLPALKKEWELKTRAMLHDTYFAPKPGNACRWCAFSKSRGGPCKY